MKNLFLFFILFVMVMAGPLVFGEEKEVPFISLIKTTFVSGEEISLTFKAKPTYEKNAWIGIIPSEVSHGLEAVNDQHDLAYQYLERQTEGILKFKAPAKPGNYDFRMHDTDSRGQEVYSVSFTVE